MMATISSTAFLARSARRLPMCRTGGCLPECGVEKTAQNLTGAKGDFLRSKAQQAGQRNDGNEIDNKDRNRVDVGDCAHHDARRNCNQQDVNPRPENRPPYLIANGEGLLRLDILEQSV